MFKYIRLLYNLVATLIIGTITLFILSFNFPLANETVNTKEKLDMTPFCFVIGIVGGCITITLLYVSWRKYKGDLKNRDKNNPNS